jgi:hypothetical protein
MNLPTELLYQFDPISINDLFNVGTEGVNCFEYEAPKKPVPIFPAIPTPNAPPTETPFHTQFKVVKPCYRIFLCIGSLVLITIFGTTTLRNTPIRIIVIKPHDIQFTLTIPVPNLVIHKRNYCLPGYKYPIFQSRKMAFQLMKYQCRWL